MGKFKNTYGFLKDRKTAYGIAPTGERLLFNA